MHEGWDLDEPVSERGQQSHSCKSDRLAPPPLSLISTVHSLQLCRLCHRVRYAEKGIGYIPIFHALGWFLGLSVEGLNTLGVIFEKVRPLFSSEQSEGKDAQ